MAQRTASGGLAIGPWVRSPRNHLADTGVRMIVGPIAIAAIIINVKMISRRAYEMNVISRIDP